MPDNAPSVKSKHAVVGFIKEKFPVTKFISSLAKALYNVHKDVTNCTHSSINAQMHNRSCVNSENVAINNSVRWVKMTNSYLYC